jgi:DNA primase catalytic subunit
MLEFRKIRDETLRLYERLAQIFFELSIVYSGRGFHIHVLDPETVLWPRSKRRRLALKLKGEGYPLDEWVTTGGMRLIRLPYSLHGMVSRVVVPLSPSALERFSPLSSRVCLPRFLRRA